MKKSYRKKPVVVTAEQWFPGSVVEGVGPYSDPDGRVDTIMMDHLPLGADPANYGWCRTLEGGHIVSPGDWIITGVMGERYPCKPDIFAATYEEVVLGDEVIRPWEKAALDVDGNWRDGYGNIVGRKTSS